jgi:superfamily II DNA/RNA helicase
MLEGRDILAMAATGTGKTAAFALPMLSRIEVRGGPPQGIVLVPTRELAAQVEESVRTYGKYSKLSSLVVYGGVGIPDWHALIPKQRGGGAFAHANAAGQAKAKGSRCAHADNDRKA